MHNITYVLQKISDFTSFHKEYQQIEPITCQQCGSNIGLFLQGKITEGEKYKDRLFVDTGWVAVSEELEGLYRE